MKFLGYLLFAVLLGLLVWQVISTVKFAKKKIKLIKEQKANKNKSVTNAEVQGELNNNKEN